MVVPRVDFSNRTLLIKQTYVPQTSLPSIDSLINKSNWRNGRAMMGKGRQEVEGLRRDAILENIFLLCV